MEINFPSKEIVLSMIIHFRFDCSFKYQIIIIRSISNEIYFETYYNEWKIPQSSISYFAKVEIIKT